MNMSAGRKILAFSFLALSACNGGGGNSKSADIPVQPAIVSALGNQNVYCEVGATTLTCFKKDMRACQTAVTSFTDVATLCARAQSLMMDNFCDTRAALNEVIRTRCQTIPVQSGVPIPGQVYPTNPWSPTQPFNPVNPIDNIQGKQSIFCKLSGSNAGVPLSGSALIPIDANFEETISLNNPMTCATSISGIMTLTYSPGRMSVLADRIKLAVNDLNSEISFSETGYAGDDVRLDVTNRRGDLNYQIECSSRGDFKKHITPRNLGRFVCRGEANLNLMDGPGRQRIDVSFPFDSALTESDLILADGLTAKVTEYGTNARIEYNAEGLGRKYSVISSAYLKTKSSFKAKSGRYFVDVSCGPEEFTRPGIAR